MKTIEEFKNFFEKELHYDLNMLESERQKVVRKIFKNIAIYLLIIVMLLISSVLLNKAIYGFYFDENEYNVPIIVGFVVSIILILLLFQKNKKLKAQFVFDFKIKIIDRILKFINDSLSYSPKDYVPLEQFMKSDIFRDRIYKYYGDDLVSGKIDKTEIKFSEIHVLSKVQSDQGRDQVKKVFDGIFFVADFHKNFNGKYYILPDFAEKRFGGLGKLFQKMNISRGKLIELEDPEFEKEFVVYGTDQVEARYLLPTSMMQRILNLKRNKFPYLFMSLVDSCLFIALPFKKQLFEPTLFRSNMDYKKSEDFFNVLNDTISIVEELNLNTRIWAKE